MSESGEKSESHDQSSPTSSSPIFPKKKLSALRGKLRDLKSSPKIMNTHQQNMPFAGGRKAWPIRDRQSHYRCACDGMECECNDRGKLPYLFLYIREIGVLCSAHTVCISVTVFSMFVCALLGLRASGSVLACKLSVMPLKMLILSIFCHDNGGLCSAHSLVTSESQFCLHVQTHLGLRAFGCMLACIVSVMPLKMLVLSIFCHDNGGLCSAHTIFMSESQFCVHVHTCLGLRASGCVLACNVSVMPLQMLILSIFCHDNGGLCSAHTAFMYESQFSACTWMRIRV